MLVPHNGCGGIDIAVEGIKEINADPSAMVRSIKGVTKESLAEKPLKIVLQDSQKYLSIGYDTANGRMTLMQQGVDAEKLPPVPEFDQICHSKIVDSKTPD